MDKDQLLKLARAGAETMVKQLRAEIIAIERTFPELALLMGGGSRSHRNRQPAHAHHVGGRHQGGLVEDREDWA